MKGFAENFHEEMERIKQEQGQAAERQERLSAALDTLRQERQTADMAISFSISSQGKRIEGLEKQGGAILGRLERLEGKAAEEAIDAYTKELMEEGAI